jgi:hypothetical protein
MGTKNVVVFMPYRLILFGVIEHGLDLAFEILSINE